MIEQRIRETLLGFCVMCLGLSCAIAAQDECEIADITWTLGPNLPEFRKGGCLTAMDGKIISVFGMRQPWGEMATMYTYDPQKAQ